MANILCIEDEEDIADAIQVGLIRAGYSATIVHDGLEGLESAREGDWSLILLDIMLPGLSGLEICRRLRLSRDRTPIVLLTARDHVSDRVQGLDAGADDYLPKPFAMEELLARVRAHLRRERFNRSSVILVHDLEINLETHSVSKKGNLVVLTQREWALLEALVTNEGRPLTREWILARVWEMDPEIASNMVEVYIKQLRRKLDDDPHLRLIHTIHGVGYVFHRPSEGVRE
jgi:DNA-binding response OmpR family regulator